MAIFDCSRRRFLQAMGLSATGLALGIAPAFAREDDVPGSLPLLPRGARPHALVHLGSDGVITIVCARSEMGQGVRSSLPALIADEMGADAAKVRIVQGDGDEAYGSQNTDGSSSVRGNLDELRQAGALARVMLIAAAAERWKVSPATLSAHDHAVHKGGEALRFEELVARAAAMPVPRSAKLRPRSELKTLGKPQPLVDAADMVTGRAIYGADVRLPGMLTAVVVRPPVVGGRVKKYDAKATLAVPGVRRVLELAPPRGPPAFQPLGGLAVVADHTWAALRGAHRLVVEWDEGVNAGYDSTEYKAMLERTVAVAGKTVRDKGDVDRALARAARTVEATYHTPHLAHAPMEPPAAVARVAEGRCEVWAPTQNPQSAREELAGALGLPQRKVTVHVTFLGGGFGRKSKPDFIIEAALIAKAMGVPVRVQWTREDDVRHDYYHSTATQRLTAGLDGGGKLTAWRHRTVFPPIASLFTGSPWSGTGDLGQGVLDLPLTLPNVRAESYAAPAHTRVGWLRSVANIYHAFAQQSFIDELAHARGVDPLQQQLELLGPARRVALGELGVRSLPNYGQSLEEHPVDTTRHRDVLERVAKAAGWAERKRRGRALGLAVHHSFLAYVAVVVSAVKRDGGVYIDEAWVCADAGTILNDDRVRSQLEGAVIFGMSAALYGEITMQRGATVQDNFRAYRLVRMPEAPRAINVEIVHSDKPPTGVGEPGVPPVAPAVANAVFALTGQRVRELPIMKHLGA